MNEPAPNKRQGYPKVKNCSRCKEPFYAAYKRTQCPACIRHHSKVWHSKNKERHKKSCHDYWVKNKEDLSAKKRAAHLSDPEKTKESRAKDYKKRRDVILAQKASYYAARREELKAKAKELRSRPHTKIVRSNANHKRRARKKGGIKTAELAEMLEASVECPYCFAPYSPARKKSPDHITPLSKGGAHTRENILICCLPCNLKKQARTPEQWAAYLAKQKQPDPCEPG